MAEDAEGAPYSIVFIETGETSNSSRDFTGKGIATYPNGEIYEGSYLNGVKTCFYLYLIFINIQGEIRKR